MSNSPDYVYPETLEHALARADRLAPPERPELLWVARASDPDVQDEQDLKTAQALRILAAEVRRYQRREPYVRKLVGAIEDTYADKCPEWRDLVTFEMAEVGC